MNKKRFNLLLSGVKRKAWSVSFNGTSATIDAGSEASIDDLHDAAFTAEGWAKATGAGSGGGYGTLFSKEKWAFRFLGSATIRGTLSCADGDVTASYTYAPDETWNHWAITWDDAGDRRLRVWRNGILVATSGTGIGAIVSDTASNMYIGSTTAAFGFWAGNIGWVRVSNSVRYTTTFTPLSRFIYPVVDANTMRLFKIDEGTGITIVDYSTNAQNGTLANGAWVKS